MEFDSLVASLRVRIATIMLALTCAVFIGRLPLLAVIAGILAVLGGLLSFHASYVLWMRFAARLQTVVTTILFGACYLLLIPVFAVFVRMGDPLRLRMSADDSTWVPIERDADDVQSYQRMG
jgi:drug/metabolite transporter (DMT)-like permease